MWLRYLAALALCAAPLEAQGMGAPPTASPARPITSVRSDHAFHNPLRAKYDRIRDTTTVTSVPGVSVPLFSGPDIQLSAGFLYSGRVYANAPDSVFVLISFGGPESAAQVRISPAAPRQVIFLVDDTLRLRFPEQFAGESIWSGIGEWVNVNASWIAVMTVADFKRIAGGHSLEIGTPQHDFKANGDMRRSLVAIASALTPDSSVASR